MSAPHLNPCTAHRRRAGLSIEQLAARAGEITPGVPITPGDVLNFEAGLLPTHYALALKLSAGLATANVGVPAADLLPNPKHARGGRR